MRNILLIFFFSLIVLSMNFACAARSSTSEEFHYALSQSVDSLRKTDDCFNSIQNNRDLMLYLQICSDEVEKIKDIMHYKIVGGSEASTCLAMAELILLNRYNALSCIQTMAESIAKNDLSGEKKATAEAHQCYRESLKWREKFKSTYGY